MESSGSVRTGAAVVVVAEAEVEVGADEMARAATEPPLRDRADDARPARLGPAMVREESCAAQAMEAAIVWCGGGVGGGGDV